MALRGQLVSVPNDPDGRSACGRCLVAQQAGHAERPERPYAFDFYSQRPESEQGVEIRRAGGVWTFRRVQAGRVDDMTHWYPTQERYVRCRTADCHAVYRLSDGNRIMEEEAEWAWTATSHE